MWFTMVIVDIPIAIAVVLKSKKKKLHVPDLVRYIMCHFRSCPCVKKDMNTYVIQIFAVGHTLFAVQILSFHAVFIFVAFIAQPLHTGLTMIFYVAIVFCLSTVVMLLYASFCVGDYKSPKKGKRREVFTSVCFGILQTSILIFFLFIVVLFGFTFLRITVIVGDTESSRISGLVGSILPSILLAVLGFMAKKVLDQKNCDDKSDIENSNPYEDYEDSNKSVVTVDNIQNHSNVDPQVEV